MLIIYRKGEVLNQIVAWGADRQRRIEGMTRLARLPADFSTHLLAELEAVLILAGAIIPQPKPPSDKDRANEEASDDEDFDNNSSSRMRSAATSTNAQAPKNIRGKTDDSDSDFEFDL